LKYGIKKKGTKEKNIYYFILFLSFSW